MCHGDIDHTVQAPVEAPLNAVTTPETMFLNISQRHLHIISPGPFFWPWGSADARPNVLRRVITAVPVIVSIVGSFEHPGNRRVRRYKYRMYTDNEGGGDMRCASIRSTVNLALAGFPVWSVHHMFGPYPTSYTWGYYRSDVSYVFGNWLNVANV